MLSSFTFSLAQQPYEFEIRQSGEGFLCETGGDKTGGYNGFGSFGGKCSLYALDYAPVSFRFWLTSNNKNDAKSNYSKVMDIDNDETLHVSFYLSNGETFTSWKAKKQGLVWCVVSSRYFENSTMYFDGNNDWDEAIYMMHQLRKYDIVKVSISDKNNNLLFELDTPNFRSAVTIDAMCKALMEKTGDQGQYGSKIYHEGHLLTNDKTNTPSTVENTTSTVSNSLIQMPSLPSQMTAMQMVMHPFGKLISDVSKYTSLKVMTDLKSLFKDNINYGSGIVYANRKNNKGHNMSYKGVLPDLITCSFKDGRVLAYSFEFLYENEKYSSDVAVKLVRDFEKELKENGIILQEKESGIDMLFLEGKYGKRTIHIRASDYSIIDYWGVCIEINFFD